MAGRNELEMMRMVDAASAMPIAAALHFAVGVIEINNEGGDGSPAAPIDTGELRGSPRVTVNSISREDSGSAPFALTRRSDVRKAAQLGGFALGDALMLTWTAGHANIIEGGRGEDKNGRMIGSDQAPDGWVWPAIETMVVRTDRWRHA